MKKVTVIPRLLSVLFLIVLSLSHIQLRSQSIANYTVTRTTGISYSSISAIGSPPSSWRNSGAFIDDDNRSFPIDIGFDFWYDGIRYTQFCVSTNGYIDFSNSVADGGPTGNPYGYVNSQYTAVGGTLNALAPFYDDMTTQGANNPLGFSIRYLLTGSAPNRILTIEWVDMAVYLNTTPSLNFQVKLHETTGIIDFLYSTMNRGTANFSYTCGINGPVLSAAPTAAQLKIQQTANTTTFSNGIQNNLNTMPTANSQLTFSSPTPLNPSGALTFTGVQTSQMTLNWPNWATNEVGYVIYNSSDNINWDFIAQTAANATSSTVTALFSGTTYYWRVFAVTEGWLSNALLGTQATLPGTTYISVVSGNWNTAATWNINAVPGPNDNVIIANGHTVTINTNASCHNLTINQGGAASILRFGSNNTTRTLTANGNISVGTNGTLTVNVASNTTHSLSLFGSLTNNGIVDLQPDNNSFCDVSFVHPYATQLLNGIGVINKYNFITVDKGSDMSRIVNVLTSTFAPALGFLNLVNGTFKLTTTGAVNLTAYTANATIPSSARLWLNSSSLTVNTTGGNINLFGDLKITNGTMNIGNAANNCLMSNGGLFTMNGGVVTIAGRYDRINVATLTRFTITNGTLILNTVGSTSATNAPFMMDVIGSQFIQSGGTIIIRRSGTGNLGFTCTGGVINSVTGGFLQIGDALSPASQIIRVNTISPVGGFRVASANVIAMLFTNPLTVQTDVEIQSGIFLANNLNVTVSGNWTNTGGTNSSGTNTTTFNSLTAKTITKTTGTESFNNLIFSNAGTKTLGSNVNCRNLTINASDTLIAGTPGFTISMIGNWSSAGYFRAGTNGTVLCNGTTAQTIGGTSVTNFRNLTIQNATGVSISNNENLYGTLTLTTGTFTTTGFNFKLKSVPAGTTGRIGQITGGNIVGNIVMERYIYNGPTQWRQLCAPVTGTTLADWNDDLVTSGFPGSDFPNMTFYSIAKYTESVTGLKEYGYSPPTNVTNPLTPKVGYFVYVGPLPVPVAVTGPPVKMNQTFTLTYTPSAGFTQDGWNMLGNPYPSSIDWDAVGWTRTNVDNTVNVWNPTLQQYASYVTGIGINGGSKNIPSSQAFWVHAIGPSPVVSLTEAVKTVVDQPFMHSAQIQTQNDLLSLTIYGTAGADQTIVRFDPLATDTFDLNLDALKFGSMDTTVPYLASVTSNLQDLGISTISTFVNNITVPLHVKVGVSGNYSIRRDSISDLPNSMCVTLEDLESGTTTQLLQNMSYNYYISDTTNAIRFLLHFGPSLTLGSFSATCSNTPNGIAFAKGTGNGPWNYIWKDISGNVIGTHSAIAGTDTIFGLIPGMYIVEVSGNDGYCSFRSDTIDVSGPLAIQTGGTLIPATCSYTNDGGIRINAITGGLPPYILTWPDGSHADSLINIPVGNYQLIVTDSNSCNDTVPFIVPTNSIVTSSFTATPDTVVIQSLISFSNYSSGGNAYEWDFGDSSPLSTTSNPIYSYLAGGTYYVSLVTSDGLCSDTSMQSVYVINNTSVFENAGNENVSVMAASHAISIQFNLPSVEHARINIYDASGKLVVDQEEYIGNGQVEIPMEVASELYSVIIILPEKIYSSKVMLVK